MILLRMMVLEESRALEVVVRECDENHCIQQARYAFRLRNVIRLCLK